MKDFFVSYTGSDSAFATWVAALLETNKYTVTIQAWDFRPGDNFVSKINEALSECKKLIMILSENYLKSKWCEAEWTSKLAEQMCLNDRRIIPIRIEPVNLSGLLSPIVYIDIVDKTQDQAAQEILNGVRDSVPREPVLGGFPGYYSVEHREIDIDYYVPQNEGENLVYIKTCTSEVLVNGKNKLHNRITWFQDEEVTVESLTDGVSIEPIDLLDTNFNFNVVFDHELEKGKEIKFRIKATLTNRNRHFKNFFSTEVITPIRDLAIHLNLEDSAINTIYTQKLSSSPMNKRSEPPKPCSFSSPYHWHIKNPELNFEYKIFWKSDSNSCI